MLVHDTLLDCTTADQRDVPELVASRPDVKSRAQSLYFISSLSYKSFFQLLYDKVVFLLNKTPNSMKIHKNNRVKKDDLLYHQLYHQLLNIITENQMNVKVYVMKKQNLKPQWKSCSYCKKHLKGKFKEHVEQNWHSLKQDQKKKMPRERERLAR